MCLMVESDGVAVEDEVVDDECSLSNMRIYVTEIQGLVEYFGVVALR